MDRRTLLTSSLAGMAAAAASAPETRAQAGGSGPPPFAETMAEMTWQEADAAAKSGASVLWAFGVIEQHGPHLPLGTDVYIPSAVLRRARQILAERGHQAVILPAFYWGINQVSGAFPGSVEVQPATMIALMADVLSSVKKQGFARVFCTSGHGDALHNKTIFDGVTAGRAASGIDAAVLFNAPLVKRLGLDTASPAVLGFEVAESPARFIDVHAGDPETSAMLHIHPELVRKDLLPTLKSTDYGPADLAEWRKGQEAARAKTPLGYFGDPASADASRGAARLEGQAKAMAEVILARVGGK
ncbi:creatininase family protein [Enterovirga aerilata]|uniref:Creatininase family protein n=1 Tax=Enterovirga aerilata TaxID=2730920 RepID=A0A849IG25_9HYPH|nr:creatininase family protein [Enterovirga sp. DB1703]NNM75165.1 creatininase family protein [Enterovirga sp. DB1703]